MTPIAARFRPPFCPNPVCRHHLAPAGWRVKRDGFHRRGCPPRRVQRYRCLHCRRSFSDQTFSTTYWLRHPEQLLPVSWRLLGCSGFRQIARELRVAPSTVAGWSARLGRHALLYSWRHRPRGELREALVLDGFESFEWSQYYPTHYHLAVGPGSHFLYGFTDSELRRKGRMTARQRRRRARLERRHGRPDPRSIEREMAALLELVAPERQRLTVYSDDHRAYPRAFRAVPHLAIEHHVTSSRARRTTRNPLFAVNLADLLIRHGGANHKRETIAFSKRRQSAVERLALFQVWRNWVKAVSERRPGNGTPAMRLRLAARPRTIEEVLAERLFPSREQLPGRLADYYWRRIRTRALARERRHRCRYAA